MEVEKQQVTKFVYAHDLPIYNFEKPYSILSTFEGCDTNTNLHWVPGEPESITDIRGFEDSFTLDQHGFEFLKSPTAFERWDDRRAVEEMYLPEIEALLKKSVPDVDEVVIFDWRKRTSARQSNKGYTDMNNPLDPLAPASQVHLDQAPAGVLKRLRLLMGDRAPLLLQGRVQIINVWRPLIPVENWPLALCDGASMSYRDLLEVDLIRKDYIGTTMYAKYRPGYKWYYLDHQTPNEVCLFKNFDSLSVNATMCPHASFEQGDATRQSKPRESIEVRAFVFTYSRASS